MQAGEIDLPTREEVVGFLRRQRLIPVAVKAKPKDISFSFGSGVKMREVVIFTRQFSTMIAAGLPLVWSPQAYRSWRAWRSRRARRAIVWFTTR